MLHPGLRLGERYRLDNRIGAGGMGEVWQAVDEVLGRVVAVKAMLPEVATEPDFARRFLAEAKAMASVSHPAVAAIHDYGHSDSITYLVMEFIDGESLSQLLGRYGRLSPADTMQLIAQAADGLQAVHDRGIVHRDIKPANLLIRRNGALLITDFGISRAHDGTSLTLSGAVLGTPTYLSPEQVLGQPATALSDVYSLGLTAYECLAGHRPFNGDNPYAVALQRLQTAPRTLSGNIPRAVLAVVENSLSTDPAGRWPTAAALAQAAREAAHSLSGGRSGPAVSGPPPGGPERPLHSGPPSHGSASGARVYGSASAAQSLGTPSGGPPAHGSLSGPPSLGGQPGTLSGPPSLGGQPGALSGPSSLGGQPGAFSGPPSLGGQPAHGSSSGPPPFGEQTTPGFRSGPQPAGSHPHTPPPHPRTPPPQSYAPPASGPHPYAPHPNGPQQYGPPAGGPHPSGPHPSGPHPSGPPSYGQAPAGPGAFGPPPSVPNQYAPPPAARPEASGPGAYGPPSFGSGAFGPPPADQQASGSGAFGPPSSGPPSSGPGAFGPAPAGSVPFGPGPSPAGVRPSGPEPAARRTRLVPVLAAIVVAVLLAGGGSAWWAFGGDGDDGASAAPETNQPAGTPESDALVLPPGFAVCGEMFCPSLPMCWRGLNESSGYAQPPGREECSEPHYHETFAAISMPSGIADVTVTEQVIANEKVRAACTAPIMASRSRDKAATKGWIRSPWPVQDEKTGAWYVYCMGGSDKGETTGSAFKPA